MSLRMRLLEVRAERGCGALRPGEMCFLSTDGRARKKNEKVTLAANEQHGQGRDSSSAGL